jgi:hypothetical protein
MSAKHLLAENSSSPDTPDSGYVALYARDDKKLYAQDSAGVETPLGGGGAANLLLNGNFAIWQRGTSHTSVSEFDYAPDRWYVLYQTAAINVARTDGSSQRYACRLTQPNATAQRLGLVQIIEGVNCRQLRGQKATLSGRARLSASGNARFAILSWTGTEDGDASTDPDPHFSDTAKDIINDWTSASYTAGGFFASSNLVVEGVGSVACDGTNWEDFSLTTSANMSASMTNVFVVVWSESTLAQNVTLDLEAVQLEAGESASTFQQRGVGEELALCRRYCFADEAVGFTRLGFGMGINSNDAIAIFNLPINLRTFPVLTTAANLFEFYATSTIVPTSLYAYRLVGNVFNLYATKTGSFTTGTMYQLRIGSTSTLFEVDAEL